MSEFIGSSDPNRFQQRQQEATAKSMLAMQRILSAIGKLPPLSSPEDRRSFAEVIGATYFNARTMEDNVWVAALQVAGLEPERICQIWDIKDTLSRQTRDAASDLGKLINPPDDQSS